MAEDPPARSDQPDPSAGADRPADSPSSPAPPPAVPLAGGEAPEPAGDAAPPPGSPYRNLWAPLILIPGLLVVVVLVVAVFIRGLGGQPKTVEDYLEDVLEGGANEWKQDLFGLTQRVLENLRIQQAGGQPEWDLDPEAVLPQLHTAWDRSREDEHEVRLVLAELMVTFDDPDGVPRLASLLELDDEADPDAMLRLPAIKVLGEVGDPRAAPAIAALGSHPDATVRAFAVIGLQKMPLEEVRETLVAALDDPSIVVRGNAAIALSKLGDPAGAPVLLAWTDPEVLAAERARDETLFRDSELVSQVRIKALEALARLRRPEDLALLERLAESDPDWNVRGAAKELHRDWTAGVEPGN